MDRRLRELERTWKSSQAYDDLVAWARGLRRTGVTTLEITEGWPEALITNYWPSITYKGIDPLDIIATADAALSPVNESQEVYLGWLPSKDQFIIGWDVWFPEDDFYDEDEDEDDAPGGGSGSIATFFTLGISEEGSICIEHSHRTIDGSALFYSDMLQYLRRQLPDLIGLRYD